MAPSPEQTLALRYTRRHNRIRLASSTAVGKAWDSLVTDVTDRSAERFATAASAISLAAQNETAASLDGYLSVLAGTAPLGLDTEAVTGAAIRAGADPFEVYLRPVITARTKLSEGLAYLDAIGAGRARAIGTAQTDVALTQRTAMASASGQYGIVGYRRVLTGKSCALCARASTQRYKSGQLMPIHGSCDCGVAPIMGDRDPGHVINKQLVKDLKAADRQGIAERHLRVGEDGTVILPDIAVHQHGELGPVLTDASHDFARLGDTAA